MEKMETMKAVIYCRVSSLKQSTEGDGLESQRARCEEFAQRRGYDVVAVFRDEASGSTVSRKGMKAMLDFVKSKRPHQHIVIIDDISRLARGLEAHYALRRQLKNAGGILKSPSIDFGDDSDSGLMENVLASVSQHQREKNKEQTRNRTHGRMLSGYYAFRAPVGYRFAKVDGHGNMLVRKEPEASVVQEVYEGFASGRFQNQTEVVLFLAANPMWPEAMRKRVTCERVYELLTRPHYAGYIDASTYGIRMKKGHHEPIISLETYQAVQERLTAKPKVPTHTNTTTDFALRGFIDCADCGNTLTACWSKGRKQHYPYYLCQSRGCPSKGKSVRRDDLEAQFSEMLSTLQPSPELHALAVEMFRDLWHARAALGDSMRTALATDIKKIESDIAALVTRIMGASSETLVVAYEKRVHDMEIEKSVLREKISQCGRPLISFEDSYRTAFDFLENPIKLWESNKLEDKRAVLKLVFASRLSYHRKTGFRTAKTSIPFSLFNSLDNTDSEESEMVPRVGLEPTLLSELDFESSASTNSTTGARSGGS
jgi:site-specific DNA recombinase